MPAHIREVILENFMSYKYARLPLSPGINIITGPNGSGKSSILLGIAVALGQTYTERGRRLSDLIRRGEDMARVTVVLDNRPVKGKRPLPWFRSDEVYFTRYLRRDGEYWHEVNGRAVPKAEAYRYLSRVGLNPDNMLIVMHQNMVEEFVFLSPQEKLRMLEDAVGLKGYRERIASAMRRLEEAREREKDLREALAKASESLEYWREAYERFLRKRELEGQLALLKRERAWAQVRDAEEELARLRAEVDGLKASIKTDKEKLAKLVESKVGLRGTLQRLEDAVLAGELSVREGLIRLRNVWEALVEAEADARLLEFRLEVKERELKSLLERERRLRLRVRELTSKARDLGERLETMRPVNDIDEELRRVELELASVGEVPPNVEEAYAKYSSAFEELASRAKEAEANRRRILEELEKRISLWREKLSAVIRDVDMAYRDFLGRLGALGSVRVVGIDDVEKAGLEITAGFPGSEPAPLDPYMHSGGERTVAVMCFFLALQSRVRSPLRAVDEFDVHMDPRNRDLILNIIFDLAAENPETQYLVITPGPLRRLPPKANIIFVQKVRMASQASRVGG